MEVKTSSGRLLCHRHAVNVQEKIAPPQVSRVDSGPNYDLLSLVDNASDDYRPANVKKKRGRHTHL